MSVIVTIKFTADTAAFRTALRERADEFEAVGKTGQSLGAIHHRFGITDGAVLALDEWESAEHFQKFFDRPEMHEFVASVGADPNVPPEITVYEAIESADRF